MLSISANPLECDNHIEWMFKIARPFVVKGECVSPSHYKNKELKKIIDEKSRDDDYDDYL